MLVILSGIVISVILTQFLNVLASMVVTFFGIVKLVKPEQLSNALAPIKVTESGIFILFNEISCS